MKINFSILLLVLSLQVFAQSYPVTGIIISLPPNPDASIIKWATGSSMLTITASAKPVNGRIDPRLESGKILMSIQKGGSKICGSYTSSSAPSANFTSATKVWSGNNAVSLLGQDCTLPSGDYELCVQFFGQGPTGLAPLSEEKCKAFTIKANEQQTYQPPQLIVPANGTVLKETDLKKPITFRWTPVIPKPRETVTYRVRVWQLMQGQNGMQAVKSNQPIITKDVDNITQALVNDLSTGPCKPPYLCDFIWNVQALNREGKSIGGNNGTSEAFRFTVQPVNDPPSILMLLMPKNGSILSANENPKFTWTNFFPGGKDGDGHYKIKIVEIKGNESPENVIRGNKPHFEKDSLIRPSFEYPTTAPKFEVGKKYVWTIQTFKRDGKPVGENNGTSEVFRFTVQPVNDPPSNLKLLMPKNGSILSANENPKFTWTNFFPGDLDGDGYYKIKIVEIKGDQSPEQQVCCLNKPHFEKDSLIRPSFEYPTTAPKFKVGKKYVWTIQTFKRDGKPVGENNGTSEAFKFSVQPVNDQPSILKLLTPKDGSILSANDRPNFTWKHERQQTGQPNTYKIKIVEIKGDQSPESVIRGNKPYFEKDSIMEIHLGGHKPHFEKDSLIRPSFQYPSTAPKFESGKKYAWTVQTLDREGKLIGKNSTYYFNFKITNDREK